MGIKVKIMVLSQNCVNSKNKTKEKSQEIRVGSQMFRASEGGNKCQFADSTTIYAFFTSMARVIVSVNSMVVSDWKSFTSTKSLQRVSEQI